MVSFFENDIQNDAFLTCYNNELNCEINIKENSGNPIIIFFTSHAVWGAPDTFDNFNDQIIVKNHYDFKNLTKSKFFVKKDCDTIFVRDICKAWYIYGINKTYNTVEKVAEFLKNKCINRKIITIGSSSGGYAAILFGSLLKAERIIAFDPQVDVKEWLRFYSQLKIYNYIPKDIWSMYPNVDKVVYGCESKIYYFYSCQSKIDILQNQKIKEFSNFKCFPLKSNDHGKTLFSENMLDIIFAKDKKIESLFLHIPKQGYSRVGFLFRSVSFFRAVSIFFRQIKKRLRKKRL